METKTTATENSTHDFEKAGLGKAPFRCTGMGQKIGPYRFTDPKTGITMEVGSPGQAMGVCAYCGQGIMDCYTIRSADGKTFEVGCDCVKRSGDAGMKKVVCAIVAKKNREKSQARYIVESARISSVLTDNAKRETLSAMPHPKGFDNKTALDYLAYMYRGCGAAGTHKLAKWLDSVGI